MNQNPYLFWAKKVRILAFFGATSEVRSAVAARIKARYNNEKPYEEAELRSAQLASAANRPIDYSAIALAEARSANIVNQIVEDFKSKYGDAATCERFHDEVLVTIDTTKF